MNNYRQKSYPVFAEQFIVGVDSNCLDVIQKNIIDDGALYIGVKPEFRHFLKTKQGDLLLENRCWVVWNNDGRIEVFSEKDFELEFEGIET